MKTIIITTRGSSRLETLKKHLSGIGLCNYRIFYGLNGEKSGLKASIPYEIDNPGSGYIIGPKAIGCLLSHWMLWNALVFENSLEDYWMILEDDVLFRDGWRESIDNALKQIPGDWDILFPGSCCSGDKISSQISGNLYECHPFCTHCYIVRKKALPVLIETNEEVWAPIDIQIYFKTRNLLKSYAILPRVADQNGTELQD